MYNKKWIVLGIGGLLVLAFILKDAFSQPDVTSLEGGFKEIAFERNEQNTGPVLRVYSVSIRDSAKADFELYGNYMPHNKYGTTLVYFFLGEENAPQNLYLDEPYFDTLRYRPIARYEKNAMGGTKLTRR